VLSKHQAVPCPAVQVLHSLVQLAHTLVVSPGTTTYISCYRNSFGYIAEIEYNNDNVVSTNTLCGTGNQQVRQPATCGSDSSAHGNKNSSKWWQFSSGFVAIKHLQQLGK